VGASVLDCARLNADVIVIGAGVAGLACARVLTRAGLRAVVVERSNGVGGRCATRRILEGQPVDHGVAFLHGSEPAFLAAIDETDTPRIEGWPFHVEGRGVPCQPDTYTARDRRVAFVDGISSFPKHLARGLDVRRGVAVARLEGDRVVQEDGQSLSAPHVVITLPVEQIGRLLPDLPELGAARALLAWLGTVPCLTVLAAYAPDVALPRFDVLYPDEGPLQVVLHDSAKRVRPTHRVLVLQASAGVSRDWLALAPEDWQAKLLAEAGRRLGDWAASPSWAVAHRWRHARFPSGAGLGSPLVVRLPHGGSLSLAGEAFGPHSGVQGAFLSGEHVARRLLGASP